MRKVGGLGVKRSGNPRAMRVPIQTIVLRTLAVTGVIGVALVAPKMASLFKYLDRPRQERARTNARVKQALARLKSKGLILIGPDGSIELSAAGVDAVERILANEYQIPEPAFWDGKWRMVAFDIKEKQRKRRDELRLLLEGVGFVRLQHSVWVHPYPCDEFIEILKNHLASKGDELFYFTAQGLQPDMTLRKHFKVGISQ
ncbi:MAG: CRISPR-associated endonuclease Cas2 [Candidatus Pacebacteria bacterium]|nr:CRISPR-associated endonuclease Cas2 [Candidatus Paceibacterota bacterium]